MSTPARAAADRIGALARLGPVETAVVLGRDFLAAADIAEQATSVPYGDLPGFPSVPGGELTLGLVEGSPMMFFRGRPEFYSTGDPSLMSSAFDTLSLLGVRAVLSTGHVTSTSADLQPPSLLSISDHINLTGLNPLIGAAGDNCVNMNAAYDKRLMRRLKQSAATAGVTMSEGVMLWLSGPSFETPAEARLARLLGVEAIGMSIAPEAILARRFALPFAGLAVVTDYAAGFCNGNPTYDPTRGAGLVALRRLLRAFQRNR